LAQESPGIEDNLNGIGTGEHREPADDRAGQEIGRLVLEDAVAGAGHWKDTKQSFGGGFPNGVWEPESLGTRTAALTTFPRSQTLFGNAVLRNSVSPAATKQSSQ